MKIARFRTGGLECFGLVESRGLTDVTAAIAGSGGLLGLIEADDKAALLCASAMGGKTFDPNQVQFLPPVPTPEKILCVGVNFLGRNEEFNDNSSAPNPSLFLRVPGSFVGHGEAIERPRLTKEFDYEGEIALVIGKSCKRVSPEDALNVVFGATLCNEGTVHDWLRHGKFNNTQGKNFDRTGSFGPYLVTTDEIDLDAPLQITTTVNGEVRQQDTTDRMIHGFRALIAYVTQFMTLHAGDILVTGTPVGCGRWYSPPRWLVDGDLVEVSVPGLGKLANIVNDETV